MEAQITLTVEQVAELIARELKAKYGVEVKTDKIRVNQDYDAVLGFTVSIELKELAKEQEKR